MLHAECYSQEERSLPFPERWPRASKFLLSACAAAVAELVTFPLDLTKTRLQIQGEAAVRRYGAAARRAVPYRGMLRTAAGIVQEEGLLKLWQGATPAVYRHIVYSGVRMVTYEHIRDSVLGRAEDKSFPLWKSVVGGMAAGAIGQFFASPTDLVKVQMQMEGKRRLEGKPLRFHGVHHAFVKILSEGGIRGLWAGWVPNVQRAALVNMGDLTTYDSVKHFLLLNTPLQDNSVTHSIASACSGLVAAILGTPADVVKTRIMNQPRDKQGRGLLYKSSADCLIQAIQGEGFMSLYKGFLPTWMRMILNLSTGHEEIVNPENVWNGIPEVTKSPYEADNLHSLSAEGSELKEKRASCSSDVMVDPYTLSSSPENATE